MQHHAPLKVGSRGRGVSDKRQKVMEACLRKVRENRTSMIAQLRTLSPASFRSEIGKIINYEWSAIEHDPGISDRDTELETIIALEQAFLEDIRREGEPQLLPPPSDSHLCPPHEHEEEQLVDQYFIEVKRFEEEQLQGMCDVPPPLVRPPQVV